MTTPSASSPTSPVEKARPHRAIRWAAILLLIYGFIETGDCLTVIAMQWGWWMIIIRRLSFLGFSD